MNILFYKDKSYRYRKLFHLHILIYQKISMSIITMRLQTNKRIRKKIDILASREFSICVKLSTTKCMYRKRPWGLNRHLNENLSSQCM